MGPLDSSYTDIWRTSKVRKMFQRLNDIVFSVHFIIYSNQIKVLKELNKQAPKVCYLKLIL